MNKLSKNATLLLASLRETAFGAVRKIGEQRWTDTDASYAEHAVGREGQPLNIPILNFDSLIVELLAAGQLSRNGDGYAVLLPSLLKESDMFNVKKASTAELVAKYNELNPGKPVKRFTDRATAEKRVDAALAGTETIDDSKAPAGKITMNLMAEPGEPILKVVPVKKPKQAALPGVEKKPRKVPVGDRLTERTIRHHVTVDGAEYKSVADAFRKLKLPMGKHIKFRGDLKTSKAGQEVFTDAKGTPFIFTLVAR